MKRKGTKIFKRLLTSALIITTIICGSNWSVSANETVLDYNVIIVCDANGNITYETIQEKSTFDVEENTIEYEAEENSLVIP